MRVMHFHFGKVGGAERFFVHLLNALARRGVAQKAVIRPKRSWRKDIDPSVEIIESHFRNASLDRLLLPLRVKRIARRWKPNAIFAWMRRGSHLMPRYDGGVRIARLGDYPLSIEDFENIDVLVCNTPGIAERVRSLGWTRRVQVITNFTRHERVAPVERSVLDTPDTVRLVCTMGRFVARKGFDTLLRAVARMENTFLWLFGDGEEEENLRNLAHELNVEDRVRFAGWQSDPCPYVAAADAFVMPSREEPLGNVILEAWAQRVPVVSTRSEGPRWFLRDGQNALLVDIDDHKGMADATLHVMENRGLADRLVAGGEKSLLEQFSEASVVKAYLELFASSPCESASDRMAA
ncbi:MAG: glycosyltransferase [Pirellulales bacterium]|nr:glycosyltransferase [Pirellulales bacterium]